MNLDAVASILCALVSLCIFGLFEISSPRRPTWLNLPGYVRSGLLLTGTMFTWRAANFASIQASPVPLGHINAEGMMALGCLAYTVCALTWFAAGKALLNHGWDRARWVVDREREDPDMVPVMMSQDAVIQAHRQQGIKAVGPGAGPDQLHEEPKP